MEEAFKQQSDDQKDVVLTIVQKIRKLMSSDKKNVPAQDFIDVGLLDYFSGLITEDFDENIQAEALHA